MKIMALGFDKSISILAYWSNLSFFALTLNPTSSSFLEQKVLDEWTMETNIKCLDWCGSEWRLKMDVFDTVGKLVACQRKKIMSENQSIL